MRTILLLLTCLALLAPSAHAALPEGTVERAVAALVELHGAEHRARARLGVEQAAARWRESDGDQAAFLDFVKEQYLADPARRDLSFQRLETALEQVQGRFTAIERELRRPMDEDLGPLVPVDRLTAAWSPSAHLTEDLFASKVAFAVLLNWPVRDLAERQENSSRWDRRTWAEARLVEPFTARVSAAARQEMAAATAAADAYISGYNIWMHHLLDEADQRLWRDPQLRLISHWNLRDELKAAYGVEDGLARQRLIATVMERIVRQEIPRDLIDNPELDWRPADNVVLREGEEVEAEREPDTRYAHLLSIFHAARTIDAERPDMPSFYHRSFEEGREMSAAEVEGLLRSLFQAPEAKRVADRIAARLGRPLEPFDIWYAGFKPRTAFTETELDALTRQRYPDAAAFQEDLHRILGELGFSQDQVILLLEHIEVDPSRGAGHALGAQLRGDRAHLRTRVNEGGMDYKGYNIAVHELGHNVEQVFSLEKMDHWLLNGVPMNAMTEALAFVFQSRDLDLLGVEVEDADQRRRQSALQTWWDTCEIAGAALVDMAVWRWLYEHPEATPGELRAAVVQISRQVWNETFGPLMGVRDSVLLGIYSHMLAYPLYLPNYPLGHLVAFQLEEHFQGRPLGGEFERICRIGRLTPQRWMREAVGAPLSIEPLRRAVDEALTAGADREGRP